MMTQGKKQIPIRMIIVAMIILMTEDEQFWSMVSKVDYEYTTGPPCPTE